jgi:hypothetical protein
MEDALRRAVSDAGEAPRRNGQGAPSVSGNRGNGAIYLLRTVEQSHVHLSSMADTKANILVGASAVIFSLLIGHMQREGFSLPVAILLVSTLMSATMAILAVMPKVKGPPPGSPLFNPLFFGCFCQLDPRRYCEEMDRVLQNESSIYTAMAMDIYGMGSVLYRKKYRFLSYSYRIFLGGLFAAFAAVIFSTLR